MITIIFAPPRTGKTCFMTHVANGYAFDKARNRAMAREIVGKIQSGFNGIKTGADSLRFGKLRYDV